jgi:hypothetical protein
MKMKAKDLFNAAKSDLAKLNQCVKTFSDLRARALQLEARASAANSNKSARQIELEARLEKLNLKRR